MAAALGYSQVSVETIPSDPLWLLVVTMSVPDPFPPGLDFDLASIYEPFVTLTAGQDPPFKVPLSPFNGGIWRNIWTTLIDPTQPLPKFIVGFWNRFGGNLNHEFEFDTWELVLSVTPTVSRQISLPRS